MANLDKIFISDLSDEEKKAQAIFGKLLISLRRNNHMKIYALMNGVSKCAVKNNILILTFSDKNSYYNMINSDDKKIIRDELEKIESGCECQIELDEKKEFNLYQFEEFLKSEFSQILTIK